MLNLYGINARSYWQLRIEDSATTNMNAVVVFGVLVSVLTELQAMPLEQQRSQSEAVHWYNLFPSSSAKEVPVYYKNEATSIWSDCSKF